MIFVEVPVGSFSHLFFLFFLIIIECHSKEPEGFCSCAFRNCSSWGWGNWYGIIWKSSCPVRMCVFFSCPLLAMKKIQLLLTRFYLTFTFTNDVFASPNRSWTLAAGCEGHNHQHTCNWGFCFLTDFLCLIIELSSSF